LFGAAEVRNTNKQNAASTPIVIGTNNDAFAGLSMRF
jgi:hypothetical protein